MKNICYLIMAIGCIILTSCGQQKSSPNGIKHVIVIGIDGMSKQGFIEANTPCMDSLMRNGAYSYNTRCVLPTVSTPNWNAMLCGAGPEITGVIDNSWNRSIDDFPPVTMSENHVFPNIFSVIRAQKPDAETAALYHWGGFRQMLEVEKISKYETYSSSLETAEATATYILEKKPDFVFIQLDAVDGYGHKNGHMSPEYIKGIEEADTHVKIITESLEKAGIAGSTMVMIVSDHGGIFYSHGGNTYEELTSPIIFSGKGIKKGHLIQQQIYRYDVAADVIFALGLKAPQVWVGRPTRAAYIGFEEPDNNWHEVAILPPPEYLSKVINTPYGGLFVDSPAEVIMKMPVGVEGIIHYTTDGTTPTNASAVYTKPFTLEKSATVTAKIFGERSESPKVSAQYRIADSKVGNGLNYSLYHLPGTKTMPKFAQFKPIVSGTCYEFGFHAPENTETPELLSALSKCENSVGVCFTGWIQIDMDGPYTFNIWSTGGTNLYIDSELVINNSNMEHSGNSGNIDLVKGFYPIRIEFFHDDKGLGSSLFATYNLPKQPAQVIPANKLFLRKPY